MTVLDRVQARIGRSLETLQNRPEVVFDLFKKFIGMVIGLSIVAASSPFTIIYVRSGEGLRLFVSILLGWLGYLFAHYAATGKFVHQKQEQRLLPKDPKKLIGAGYGIVLLTAGATIWIMAISTNQFIIAALGGITTLLGYVIAHYELTGVLL